MSTTHPNTDREDGTAIDSLDLDDAVFFDHYQAPPFIASDDTEEKAPAAQVLPAADTDTSDPFAEPAWLRDLESREASYASKAKPVQGQAPSPLLRGSALAVLSGMLGAVVLILPMFLWVTLTGFYGETLDLPHLPANPIELTEQPTTTTAQAAPPGHRTPAHGETLRQAKLSAFQQHAVH
jgi:hypothetical protein